MPSNNLFITDFSFHSIGVVMELFKLDFDDAYQYSAAEKYALTLVSFDGDFDGTELRRKMPHEVV